MFPPATHGPKEDHLVARGIATSASVWPGKGSVNRKHPAGPVLMSRLAGSATPEPELQPSSLVLWLRKQESRDVE